MRYALPLACVLCAAVCGSLPATATERTAGQTDQIGTPARSNARIGSALFLAVTRAGARLVAVGERGFVLLSDDAGRTWRQARSVPVSVTLTNVRFVSAELGWASGHAAVVLHSRDGGESWVRQLDGTQAAALVLEDAQAGLAQGDEAASRLLRDAERFVADGPDKPLLGLHFSDERHGWVVGAYGLALATDDGGRSWHSIMRRVDNRAGKHLYDIREAEGGLVIAGEQGVLLRAENGGEHFAPLASPYAGTYFGTLSAGGSLLAYGLRGNVYRRAEGAASWQKIDPGLPVTVTAAIELVDHSIVLADQTGRVLHSHDGGKRFAALPASGSRSFTGLAQAGDGALILSGMGGMTRIEPDVLAMEAQR
jgi:photosystem II stability/assembly factor-like uncharacterized protein